jgi:hypothetical protein
MITLIFTTSIVVFIETQFSSSDSSKALFLLFGLTILTYTLSGTLSNFISWIYYFIYKTSGYDPIGNIFAQIELDEKEIEKNATKKLTNFHK